MSEILKEKEEIKEFLKNLGIEYRFSCYSEHNPEGCQLLADYLAQVESDYEKSNKVLKDNCDQRNFGRSCSSYGINILNGRGFTNENRDYKTAMKYFIKACEQNDVTGCDFAGKILTGLEPALRQHIEPDYQKGLGYLEHGCLVDSSAQLFEKSECCYAASFVHASDAVKQNNEKAIEFGTKSCDLGNINSCILVSAIYRRLKNEEMSKKFSARAEQFRKQMDIGIEMQRT